eukprot:scaffold4.g4718.t1
MAACAAALAALPSSTGRTSEPRQLPAVQRQTARRRWARRAAGAALAQAAEVRPPAAVAGMEPFLDRLKWDSNGLVVAIAQHVDTGEVLMQAFADWEAVNETLQTGLATFYSRSRKERWCKGETSGHFIKVLSVYIDCDRDSLIYLAEPIGPACHTNADTCYFQRIAVEESSASGAPALDVAGGHESRDHAPMTTLFALQRTIAARRAAAEAGGGGGKPSWTARLLADPALACKKVREEAGELCQAWEQREGRERVASEAADLLYHSLVLLNISGVSLEEVCAELRSREGRSGVEEKAARPPKA